MEYCTNVIELKKIIIDRKFETITQLSEVSGISRLTLGKVLSGEYQPSTETMYKLADVLNLDSITAGKIFFSPVLTQ